jgi:hypothetical protein
MLSETFYVGLYSALMGFVLAISAQCYKSKCKEVSCGCLKIIRDVQGEEELDVQQLRNPIREPQRSPEAL